MMAPSKCIVFVVLALFAVASLQPAAAVRDAQVFKPAAAHQEAPETTNADVNQPSALPGLPPLPPLPQFPIPQLPPLPPLPQFQVPQLPPLPPLPQFQIPQLPPLPPLPQFQIPQMPPLPPLPQFPIPQLPPLPPLPQFLIPQLPPLPPLPQFLIPQLPPLPPLPPMPFSPGSPQMSTPAAMSSLLASPPPPQQPAECLSSLMELMPCMEYLTKSSVAAPPSTCCSGFKTLVEKAPICLCHGINGNINRITPAPIDFMRMMSLPATCAVMPPLQTLAQCSTGPVPPLMPAPTPAAAPSPGPSA